VAIRVVPYSPEWPRQYERVAEQLRDGLRAIPSARVEHVGSTSIPALAAKPVIDIDVVVPAHDVAAAVAALAAMGYQPRGDLGVSGREALGAPDDNPRRHVYVCASGCLSLRNHLAVRDVLRVRPDLRDRYAAIKIALAQDPELTIEQYLAGKSEILQEVLALADITPEERQEIWQLNNAG